MKANKKRYIKAVLVGMLISISITLYVINIKKTNEYMKIIHSKDLHIQELERQKNDVINEKEKLELTLQELQKEDKE